MSNTPIFGRAGPDFQTPEWRQLTTLLTDRLTRYRMDLESPRLTENETAVIRGRITELKELLSLPELAARAAAAKLGALAYDD